MKQLHKQSGGIKRDDEISSVSHSTLKHSSNRSSYLPKSIACVLREQRMLFIVVGILIGSTFFVIQPTLFRLSTSDSGSHSALGIWNRDQVVSCAGRTGGGFGYELTGRVPVGIGRRRMRIVVTGGAGFVGSHLVDTLRDKGQSVKIMRL